MKSSTIAIIGGGNMGRSLIGGLISNKYAPDKLFITDQDPDKLETLQEEFGVNTTRDNIEAAKKADVIILAVKPQVFAEVAAELREIVQKRQPLVISIAAGIRISKIEEWFEEDLSIVRAMPNTAALIGCSATALIANKLVDPAERELAQEILQALGVVVWLKDEDEMDIVTGLSGSGPAYFFLVMEALQAAAEELGLEAQTAKLLTLQTALGAACLAIESDFTPAELRQKVTSPGGTTQSAVAVLEQGDLRKLFRNALQAAKIRSEELAESTGK